MKHLLIASITCLWTSSSIFAQITDPKATEMWQPQPRVVTPGTSNHLPPSDAVLLDPSKWMHLDGSTLKWDVKDGVMSVKKGSGEIKSKELYGSIQLHLEWRTPENNGKEGQGRGNSGVFFMERYELQVLDNFETETYANGQDASMYKQTPPLVNACRKPLEWQTYDVVFTSPEFNKDSMCVRPAFITVFHNGVLVQNHTEIKGASQYIGLPFYQMHGKAALKLQDIGDAVSYRNI